jgi:FkbM family methyltransferase
MIRDIISMITGNKYFQNLLEKNIRLSLYFTGIGSGAGVQNSGEKSILRLLKAEKEPFCIFDVGANKGQYLNMVLEELKEKEFEIHSFEPAKSSFNSIKVDEADRKKVKLNNTGLGMNEGEYLLYSDKEGSSLASLTKRKLDHFGLKFDITESIQIITLDNYCIQNGIKHIHLLKIDVEGHEMDVLKGASKMFDSNSIDIVTFEFGGCNIDTRSFFQDFYYFFKEQKMKLYRITPSGYLFHIEAYKEQYEQFVTTNFVAVKAL